jgi:hypothetical protein
MAMEGAETTRKMSRDPVVTAGQRQNGTPADREREKPAQRNAPGNLFFRIILSGFVEVRYEYAC